MKRKTEILVKSDYEDGTVYEYSQSASGLELNFDEFMEMFISIASQLYSKSLVDEYFND